MAKEQDQQSAASPLAASRTDEIAALKAQIAAKDEELSELRESTKHAAGDFPRQVQAATRHKLWEFEVSVKNDPKLPTLKIKAVDGSEAIRIYALTAGKKPLDTTRMSWNVRCLEQQKRLKAAAARKSFRMAERGGLVPEPMNVG